MKKFVFWVSIFAIATTILSIKQEYRLTESEDRVKALEQRVDFFQKVWDNVPEEYRKEVAP